VKPTRFRYHAPSTVDEALTLLSEHGEEASVLAGGQSLMPMLNLRLAQPPELVDLNGVADLSYVRHEHGSLAIGAMTRQRVVERSIAVVEAAPLLTRVLADVGYPSTRNRGTIGGTVAHADPAGEVPCALIALDAEIVLATRERQRVLPADGFFLGPYMTQREPDEAIVELRIPTITRAFGFAEFARKSGDFALAMSAVAFAGGETRIAVGGSGPAPTRVHAAEAELGGPTPWAAEAIASAAQIAAEAVEISDDAHGSASYRRRVLAVVVRRALELAAVSVTAGIARGSNV
jgi:CO/xanthine dehydrogenase FAD-binding subunit